MDTSESTHKSGNKTELKLIKSLWGIDDPVSPKLFKSIREEGYFGVEVIRLCWIDENSRNVLVNSLNEAGLGCVAQMHTSGGYLDQDSGEYVYCGAYDVAVHQEDFRKQLRECKELFGLVNRGGFINVHAGVDAWSNDEVIQFFEFCFKEIGITAPDITVTFETHRQRIFGNPFQTRDLLALPALSQSKYLKLNADLSHWYCACERVFSPKDEDRDKWWPSVLASISPRCEYIHARFGWAQGPQIADPSAPECEQDRKLQIEIWKELVQEQLKATHVSGGGPRDIFISPEYGPAPYLALKPRTQEPVASLPDAVLYTKNRIEELFESIS
uniref:Xylose isomerase-like TIM barrel domain-containing protein n=1 Tax=Pseudo-nitzschia australis TaxID=44445 RepID=A0A7S4APE4_9STRA|mmetsp:Transcript_15988/g.34641  ORF Transcript_15988/g.34641 Transcript_15988/m.34641 type:complete len:329 (+) Transcript_15988:231-1217(+)|eukprot:CAMPEP_0168175010 /NCGR_PEP_ID=MMETSP0139_2-20121125/6859_1 /TAXON_ID=44445 /ORGANISM="Pseudo-nitzschia australis, Strain 10249 10 AB" /LENGTH=328 /DNA_ID=CAMNT_0008093299 /DNA_START=218 /DNA_END=1207 /DNA_ORIENTATION=-